MTVKEIFPHPLSVHSYLLRIRGGLGMYMESGLLDLLSIAPLNENSYKPADLYYDDTLEDYWITSTALMGQIKVSSTSITYSPRDEGPSLAVGCDEDDLVDRITMSDFLFTGDSEVATANSNVFCPETRAILNKRRAQSFFPASAFNAKMRLLIQSIYGSKRDYTMDHVFQYLGGLIIAGASLNPYFSGYALYTGNDYQYFVLELASTVRVNRLELSAQGEKLRQWLISNPQSDEEQRRYEGYLLSTASFGSWHTVGSASTSGETFGYSWKTNWAGDEAHIVTHQLKEGTTNVWEFTHHKLEVSLTFNASDPDYWQKSDKWAFDLTTVEDAVEATFRVNEDLIWSPDFVVGGMELFVSQDDAFDVPTHVDTDIPVYPIYNYADDSFDMVRFKREDRGSGAGSFGGQGSFSDSISSIGIGCGDYGCVVKSDSDGTTELGFYLSKIGGADISDWAAVNKTGDGVQVKANEAGLTGGPNEVSCGGLVAGPFCGSPPERDSSNHAHYPAFGGGCTLRGDFNFEALLAVPYFDCDAVYLGSDWSFGGRIDSGHTLPGANVWAGAYLYNGGEPVGGNPNRTEWDWFTSSNPGGGNGGACTPSSKFLFLRSQGQGLFVGGNKSSDHVFSEVIVKMYANGEFHTVHENRVTDDLDVSGWLFIPSCLNPNGTPLLSAPSWQQGSVDHGGFEFDPVVFPIPEQALPVIARGNLTGNFRATKNPGGDTHIDEGEYDYDNYSQFISYVGHD